MDGSWQQPNGGSAVEISTVPGGTDRGTGAAVAPALEAVVPAEEVAAVPAAVAPKPEAPKPIEDPNAGNIGKIRDILFGHHMRDYESRFIRLDQTLKRETEELRETTRKSLETLEAYVKQELAALQTRV